MTSSDIWRRVSGRNLTWAVWLALAALLGFYWMKFAYNAYLAAIFVGELDYGEGIVWQQALLIPGSRMYGDLDSYPFLVFHYPPLYHLVVHAFAALGVPWLVAGRFVSIASTFFIAVLSAGVVFEAIRGFNLSRSAALASALLPGLLIVTLHPVDSWGATMRVDMLAIALELLGMYLGLRSVHRPNLIYASALIFVLAAFTKQTTVWGAIATFVVLLLNNPSRTLRAALFAAVIGGFAFTALTVITNGGFAKHIILYNINRFSLQEAFEKLISTRLLSSYSIYLSIATAAALVGLRRVMLLHESNVGHAVIALYFLLSMTNVVSLGKTGSDINYLIPWVCSWVLLIGVVLGAALQHAEQKTSYAPVLVLLSALILQSFATPVFGDRRMVDPEVRKQYTELIALTRRASKPVLSEDIVVLMQAGKEVPWEPSIISELTAKGVFDERKVVDMIEAKELAFAIVTTSIENRERYSPAVGAALKNAYPVEQSFGQFLVLSPDEIAKDSYQR